MKMVTKKRRKRMTQLMSETESDIDEARLQSVISFRAGSSFWPIGMLDQ